MNNLSAQTNEIDHSPLSPGLPRVGSTKHRKVSTQSLHSANSTEETVSSSYAIFEEEENEDAQNFESETSPGISYEDKCLGDNMPWVKVISNVFIHKLNH